MIKLPNINEQKCLTDAETKCPTGDDPATLTPELVIKPALVLMCDEGTIQFRTFLRSSTGEMEITSGLTYSSSNSASVTIDPSTGSATVLAAGVVTISVTWQTYSAHAQATILGGENCCDDIAVGGLLVIDRSKSMGLEYNASYPTLLAAAKYLANAYAGQLLAKDSLGVEQFAISSSILLALTNVIADIQAAVNGISLSTTDDGEPDTDISGAMMLAIDTLAAATGLDRKIILLFSDGRNRNPLSETEREELLAAAEAFKSGGGIIIAVGIRASGDGYTLLQQLSSGGFFLNATGQDWSLEDTLQALLCMMGYYCAGTRPPSGYGYTCSGYNCCDQPPGVQQPDPSPLADVEAGESGFYTSTQTQCASCPTGMAPLSPGNIIPRMTGYTTPSGQASATTEFSGALAWHAFSADPDTGTGPALPMWTCLGTDSAPKLQYVFPVARVVTRYRIIGLPLLYYYSPRDWTMEGSNDGSSWTVLDTQAGVLFTSGETKYFNIASPAAYRYYRLNITASGSGTLDGGGANSTGLLQWAMYGRPLDEECATANGTSTTSQQDANDQAAANAIALAQSRLGCVSSNNTQPLIINDRTGSGPATASPYPSVTVVSGQSGAITNVTVTLTDFRHTFPDDVRIVLKSPSGTVVELMRNCGGGTDVSGLNFVFDDAAVGNLPDETVLSSGTFKPSQYGTALSFPSPGPASPFDTTLAAFIGENPNGVWSLWVVDDSAIDSGQIASGWSLTITAA